MSHGPGLPFDAPVPPGGYAWWYVDVLDDAGDLGLTLIFFVGSVFSPWYAAARRRGGGLADPDAHPAVNAVLYRRRAGGRRWCMTEHPRAQLSRGPDHVEVGRNRMRWEGDTLVVDFDAVTAPFPRRLAGTVRLHPAARFDLCHALDSAGDHRWWPIAPIAEAEVTLTHPALRFRGAGYHDANRGLAPVERDLAAWRWSRTAAGGEAVLVYESEPRLGERTLFARRFGPDGSTIPIEAPARVVAPTGAWGVRGALPAPDSSAVSWVRRLEDTPFYLRDRLQITWPGLPPGETMAEHLDCDRFAARWVQTLLPFKCRRAGGGQD